MIDNIFGNKTNVLVLRFLAKFNNQFFTKEEIAKEIGAGPRNVYDSLQALSYEKILTKKYTTGKLFYKFVVDSKVKELIYSLFQEERERLPLKTTKFYKLISEIESKIIKIVGSNLVDIFLFGSVAKGRDTETSDIDLCVLLDKHNSKVEKKITTMSFDKKFSREVQMHIFTASELLEGQKNKNPLVMNILRDGLSLKIGK